MADSRHFLDAVIQDPTETFFFFFSLKALRSTEKN